MSTQPHPPSTDPNSRPKTAFISGPTDTGPDQVFFAKHYIPALNTAIAAGHNFIIGPILSGVDADALDYLLSYPIPPSRVTIYMTHSENVAWGKLFRERGVRVFVLEDISATTAMRDARMTADSDYDILRWRTEEEARGFYGEMYRGGYVTNTERNWRRRRGLAETGELGRGSISVEEMVARE
ncbi:hypothetical protein BJX68DRAFT_269488 [Aspergillus pseudodeflectus]|uniref:Uncharacterized protein n=1 Tax=Aspergillus pseudodeflectus TaxID=176178 RepID=A0ABR4JY37_9EURO